MRLLGKGQAVRPLQGCGVKGRATLSLSPAVAPSSPGASRWLQPFALVPEDGALSVPTRSTRTSCSTTPVATVRTPRGAEPLGPSFTGSSLAPPPACSRRLLPCCSETERQGVVPCACPAHVLFPLPGALAPASLYP